MFAGAGLIAINAVVEEVPRQFTLARAVVVAKASPAPVPVPLTQFDRAQVKAPIFELASSTGSWGE